AYPQQQPGYPPQQPAWPPQQQPGYPPQQPAWPPQQPAWPPPQQPAWTPPPARPSRHARGTAAGLETRYVPTPARAPAAVGKDPDSYLTPLTGQIGLYHMSTAEVGPAGHLRLGLHGQYFSSSGFLVQEMDGSTDTNTRFGGSFTFGFTPHESIELFGAIL